MNMRDIDTSIKRWKSAATNSNSAQFRNWLSGFPKLYQVQITMSSNIDSTTKVVFITGANQGIGLETARQLALKNYHVLLGSRNAQNGANAVAALQKDAPNTLSITPITIDVTSDSSISAAVSQVETQYGRLDVLINNAGISLESYTAPTSREMFHSVLDINVIGAYLLTNAFIPLLSLSTAPRIVFMSSNLGSVGWLLDPKNTYSGVPLPAYRASKAALNMITGYYANTHKENKWKINAVCVSP
jgi:NAD(P)-dependent dehydrogenase (short-subunit alcohol dehydrogenase family)